MNTIHPFTRLSTLPVVILLAALSTADAAGRRLSTLGRSDEGQSTAEYALVLLGVAAIAIGVVSWVSEANPISRLFGFVWDNVIGKSKG